MTDFPMIAVVNVLQYRHSSDFSGNTCKQPTCLFCVVTYHHKLVIKLRENRFDALSETLVNPRWLFPVFLVQPIGYFKSDTGSFKKVQLYIGTQVSFITKHFTVVIIPLHIFQVVYVMYVCSRHVISMDNTTYSADCVQFISMIKHTLGSTKTRGWRTLRIVFSHSATLYPCHLTDLDRFGVYHKNCFPAIYTSGNILTDLFCKAGRKFAAGIELSPGYKIRYGFGRRSQPFEEIILAVITECFCCKGKGYDLQIREGGNNTATGYIAMFIYAISCKFLADVVDFSELYDKVVHTPI